MTERFGQLNVEAKTTQFEAIVQAYSKDLYRFGIWLTRDAQVTEDLVQETFLRAWKAIDPLKDPKADKSWLFTNLSA